MEINKSRILITGGTSGIGYEIAKQLVQRGASVVICGRYQSTVEEKAQELGVLGVQADVSIEADVERAFQFSLEKLGGLDVLINNAGLGHFAPLTEMSTEDFTRIWEINVRGAFFAGRLAARHFITQKAGNIINIGSTAALNGSANGTAYMASKFALRGMTECWRAELRQHNIRVMQINPSEVITDFGPKLGREPSNTERKLKAAEIAHLAVSMLSLSDIGFIPEASVWATNP